MHLHMIDIVDTAFCYERELIVCSQLQDFSKGKGSSLQVISNAHTAFLLCTADRQTCTVGYKIIKNPFAKQEQNLSVLTALQPFIHYGCSTITPDENKLFWGKFCENLIFCGKAVLCTAFLCASGRSIIILRHGVCFGGNS